MIAEAIAIVTSSGGGTLQHWYEIAGIIIAIPVACGIAWAIFKGIGHVQRVHEAIIGREGTSYSEHVPSMIERFHAVDDHLAKQDDRLEGIESELVMNGGGSLKDDVLGLRGDVRRMMAVQATDSGRARAEVSTQQSERERVQERDHQRSR